MPAITTKARPGKPEVIGPEPSLDDHASTDVAEERVVFDQMAAYYAAQPKVSIRVSEDQFVQCKGYAFLIKGGERVLVPEEIAQILESAGRI